MSRRPGGWRTARALILAAWLALAAFAVADTGHASGADVRGLWVDQRDPGKRKVGVWIEDCEGQLCGRIVWLRKPLSGGRPKQDKHNPDARLRDRPLCGLRILTGFRRAGDGVWNAGQVYNPNDGRTFSSTMTLEGDGGLRIRGYVGAALFGKTVDWVRPQDKLSHCG
jgi:uncharacterized protein (DUF2147 family)